MENLDPALLASLDPRALEGLLQSMAASMPKTEQLCKGFTPSEDLKKKEAAIEKRWNKQDKDALWYKIVKPIQLKLNGLLDQSGYEYRIMWVEDRYNAFEVDLEELAKRKRREEGRTEL